MTAVDVAGRVTAPLSRLRFGGDHPDGSIDARKTKSEDGLPELLASILANGLIYPLIVRTHANGKIYVAEGNRRLAAMRLGVLQKKLEKNFEVRIEEMAEGVDAIELSLTANIMRLPMHEVDQYEAFVTLRDGGAGVGEIASRFGTSELMVNRRLALGSLSPKLRQAWREDKIKAEAAMAFTNVEDHELQDRVYASLAQGANLHRYSILRALLRSDDSAAGELRFVGRDAYEAAGGRLHFDLFKEEAHVLDPEILKRLERQKLDTVCQDLLAAGWAWAALGADLPGGRYNWSKIEHEPAYSDGEVFRLEELRGIIARPVNDPAFDREVLGAANAEMARLVDSARLRAFTPEDKAASGCILTLSYRGELDVQHGVVRPGSDLGGFLPADARPAGPAPDDEDGGSPASPAPSALEISGALAQTVSEWTTIAAANALADEPDLALRVLLAALQSYGAPARFSRSGWSGLRDGMKDKPPARDLSFAKALENTLRTGMPHLKAALAAEVARSLDLTAAAALHPAYAIKEGASLVDALDADGYLGAARHAFDPSVFFDRAPASVAIAAVAEMGGPKPTGKKGVIALAAADLARDLGWLPPGMRSSAYVPPQIATMPGKAEGSTRGRRKAPAGAPHSA